MGYAQSKTANILFARELDSRGEPAGIRGFSLHPGSIISTDLSPWATNEDYLAMRLIGEDGNPVIVEQGASTGVWCATSPMLTGHGGVYCENNDISPLASPDDTDAAARGEWPVGVAPHAIDLEAARELWALSERETGVALADAG